MNLPLQLTVSLVFTAITWIAGHLVRRRVLQVAREAGFEGPLQQDMGIEVSPGLLRADGITDLLYRWRFSLLGALFGFSFVSVGLIFEAFFPGTIDS